jgi:voltage-gated potassium channel Kch
VTTTGAEPSAWSGHVIVCGLHGVGLRTVEQLHRAGVPVVVVDADPNPRLVPVVAGWGVPHLRGGDLAGALRDAGLAGAAAVVCVEHDDLRTLEAALLAREARPDVRVIVQLANPAVGRAISAAGGPGAVLDVAALAAPSVVEACLRLPTHELDLDGEPHLVVSTRAPRAGTLRELYADLTPLVVTGSTGSVSLCPGRDLAVRAGDDVALLGTAADLAGAGIAVDPAGASSNRRPVVLRPGRVWPDGERPSRGRAAWAVLVRALAGEVDRRLRAAVVVLLTLVAGATTVLHLGYREPGGGSMSWLDGLYFTVETIATVGYGDFSFRQQPTWLRVFAVGLMAGGAALAAVFFALLTNLLVSRRIEESLGRRHVPGLAGHTVVIGTGSVGIRVVEALLARGRQVVVVERDGGGRYLPRLRELGVPVVVGDATQRPTLEAANVAAAGSVAVLTSDDLTNLETGLAVRDLTGDAAPVVLRLFDRDLARTVEATFGFRDVRSTAVLAAPWFVGAALGLDVLATFYVHRLPLLLARLTVPAGGALDGTAMQDLGALLRVVAIRRAAAAAPAPLEHAPRRRARLAGGDVAYVVGPYEELIRLLRRG